MLCVGETKRKWLNDRKKAESSPTRVLEGGKAIGFEKPTIIGREIWREKKRL